MQYARRETVGTQIPLGMQQEQKEKPYQGVYVERTVVYIRSFQMRLPFDTDATALL